MRKKIITRSKKGLNSIKTKNLSVFWSITFLSVILISCGNKISEDNLQVININNSLLKDTADISNLIDTISIIKLNENVNVPLTDPFQLYAISQEQYVVLNYSSGDRRVIAFNKSGDYIKTIAKNGTDSTDGLNIADCFVDKNGMLIYDFAQNRITVYDTSLNLMKTVQGDKSRHYSHLARFSQSSDYVGFANFNLYNPNRSLIDIFDENFETPNKSYFSFPSSDRRLLVLTYNKSFYQYGDTLRFYKHFDPSIYSITKTGVSRRFEIKYTEGSVSRNKLMSIIEQNFDKFNVDNPTPSDQRIALFDGLAFPNGNYLENKRFIYITSQFYKKGQHKNFVSLISKKDLHDFTTAKALTENKRFGIILPPLVEYDKYKDEHLAILSGAQLKSVLLAGNKLMGGLSIDLPAYYLIKVKFKNETE